MHCVHKNAGARIVAPHCAGGRLTTRIHAGILCVSECGAMQAIVLSLFANEVNLVCTRKKCVYFTYLNLCWYLPGRKCAQLLKA